MGRGNLIVVNSHQDYFLCIPCNRLFNTENGLLSHCRNAYVHEDEWCDRCEWLFTSPHALQQHIEMSTQHWECQFCEDDLEDEDELEEHLKDEHNFCYKCLKSFKHHNCRRGTRHDVPARATPMPVQMTQPAPVRTLPQQMALIQYEPQPVQTSRQLALVTTSTALSKVPEQPPHNTQYFPEHPRDIQCYGCEARYTSHASILIHLENGGCDGIDWHDVDKWAFGLKGSHAYTNHRQDYYKYRCPQCDADFRRVSALFQHVESGACNAGYWGVLGELRAHIEKMVRQW